MIETLRQRLYHTSVPHGNIKECDGSLLINADYNDIVPLIDPVDLILADLPYGSTQAAFDKRIDMVSDAAKAKVGLWSWYHSLLKHNGLVILTADLPFAAYLLSTAPQYGFQLHTDWVWEKTAATGHLGVNYHPMKAHEYVLVFRKKKSKGHAYNPQITEGHTPINSYTKTVKTQNNTELYGRMNREISGGGETTRFPRSVLKFKSDKQRSKLHPTQKPVKFLEYMIKSYSDPGDVVLDNAAGSLGTAEACNNTGRRCIAIEIDSNYFQKGLTRFKL